MNKPRFSTTNLRLLPWLKKKLSPRQEALGPKNAEFNRLDYLNRLGVKILLVNDHQVVMDGIKYLLRKSDDVWGVGECLNGQDALGFLATKDVDLLITDLQLHGMSAIEPIQAVKQRHPRLKILVLSMHHDLHVVHQVFQAQTEGGIVGNCGRIQQQANRLRTGYQSGYS